MAESARKLMDLYEKSVIPGANLALESSMASYETGSSISFGVFEFHDRGGLRIDVSRRDDAVPRGAGALEEMTGMETGAMKSIAGSVIDCRRLCGRLRIWPLVCQAGSRPRTGAKILYWVDAMHPWYKSDKPGIAPDCGMKLVPVYAGEAGATHEGPGRRGADSAGETATHRRCSTARPNTKPSPSAIRAAARVTLDETRIAKVQTKLEGWINQVFVDFTGK